MAGALVYMSFLPNVSIGTLQATQLFLLLLNAPAAEQESVQQPEVRVMPLNANKSFLGGAQPAFVPSTATSETTWCSCPWTIRGMHLLVKGQPEKKKEITTPSLTVYVHF